MREHVLRRQVVEEMHLRRWPHLEPQGEVIQIVWIVSPTEREKELTLLKTGLAEGLEPPAPQDRHFSGELYNGVHLAWERHTEGSSVTAFFSGTDGDRDFAKVREWMERFPGQVVRATHINILPDEAAAEAMLQGMPFGKAELVSSRLAGGSRFWSDFRIHDGNYGRVVIASNGCDPVALSRSVQQLQELGNYRNMALLALPEVREQWTELDGVEERLRQFAAEVSDPDSRDDMLLEQVSGLSLELTNLSNRIGYRLDATKAYAELVGERLDDLQPEPISGYHSLRDFARRRFLPAVRTCAAYRERLDKLTARSADLTALLRARVETRIENQNAKLLESMERRAAQQLRLQQLVEGLSIVAISYYGVNLLAYVLKGAAHALPLGDVDLVIALSVPVTMVVIWLFMRLAKRKLLDDPDP